MKSVYEIRRENLRKLFATWGGPTSLSKKLGLSNGSYLAQLAGPNPSREISEKVAREFEGKLKITQGWMDLEHGDAPKLDDQILGDCVRAVAAALRDAGIRPDPDRYAILTALAYDYLRLTGHIDEQYISKLISLMK